jgi:hypothetical protein
MKTRFPAYVVLNVPEPIRSIVSEIRRKLQYRGAGLPVEITLAGSSGVGPIPPGLFITNSHWRIGTSAFPFFTTNVS